MPMRGAVQRGTLSEIPSFSLSDWPCDKPGVGRLDPPNTDPPGDDLRTSGNRAENILNSTFS